MYPIRGFVEEIVPDPPKHLYSRNPGRDSEYAPVIFTLFDRVNPFSPSKSLSTTFSDTLTSPVGPPPRYQTP